MALTNAQYDTIQRGYEEKRLRHEKELRVRLNQAREKYPRLAEIDTQIADLSLKKARIRLGASTDADFDLDEAIAELGQERSVLLKMAGFPNGVAEPACDCELCHDTGMVNGRKCACFRQAEISLIYAQSRLSDILQQENFDTFSLQWYSEELVNPATNLTARETARRARDYAKAYTEQFRGGSNICFYGKTGVGKTFLSHCIAKALMDKGVSVLYLTAFDLFRILEDDTFRQTEATRENTRFLFDCELLIIDDLGANMNNSFISSQLFHCINERILTGKSTIISTNLSVSELRDAYSDRVVSRITSSYQRLYLFGEDIRIQKKLSKGA